MRYERFWLLETVVDANIALHRIAAPHRAIEQNLFKPSHRLQKSELLQEIRKLISLGMIEVFESRNHEHCIAAEELSLHSLNRKSEEKYLCYQLTHKGGVEWEKQAKADWSRFYSYVVDYEDDRGSAGLIRLEANSEAACRQSLQVTCLTHGIYVDERDISFTDVDPWNATYWKTLDKGKKLFAHCSESGNSPCHVEQMAKIAQSLRSSGVLTDRRVRRPWYVPHPDTPKKFFARF